MKARLLVALVAGLAVGSGEPPPCGEVQSQEIPPGSKWLQANYNWVWEFKKDGSLQITFRDSDTRLFPRYILNPRATPPQIDLKCVGRDTIRGIYRIEGDRLVLRHFGVNTARPTSFVCRPEQSFRATLKRLK